MNKISQSRKMKWQRTQRREFVRLNGYSTGANYRVGGVRKEILNRDGHKCVKCFMTDKEHFERFGRPITIDHKDKNRKNNNMSNLQTLCLSCHGKKDQLPKLREKKFSPYINQAMAMKSLGKTYRYIASHFNVSTATVWKYLTGRTYE